MTRRAPIPLANHRRAFLQPTARAASSQQWCTCQDSERINVKEFYQAYRAWAEESGHQILAKNSFGRALRGLITKLKTTGVGAKRDYVGVALAGSGRDQLATLMAEKGQKRQ